ncbi:hypothetical protein [Oceanobacillus kapialis]|uniref:Spore coat protein n=1 Tax=Oceanobacillus kapialis TaxID=481353 RepID=A0ABW5PYU8_9BACI
MEHIPVVDLGLMSDHLTAHEGMLQKLQAYQEMATSTELKKILALQYQTMSDHVRVMLELINPYHATYVELSPINMAILQQNNMGHFGISQDDQWIAREAHTSSKDMANTNFTSALMMQNQNVRNVHIKMALQQLTLMELYEQFLERLGTSFVPRASNEEQLRTYNHFKSVFSL